MSVDVTQEQLDGLGARFDKGFDEIKSLLRSFDDRMRAVELQEASSHPLINSQIVAIQAQQIATQKEVDEIRRNMSKQIQSQTVLSQSINTIINWGKWVAGIITTLVSAGLLFFIGRLVYVAVSGSN